MKKVELTKGIYWVGAVDWNIRNFHGYLTQRGTTYNAYLIIDEKITLIDTTKADFSREMIDRISAIVDPSKIEYIVSNHVEMDHSGSIPELLKYCPDAEIIATSKGEEGLRDHYRQNWKFKVVDSGDEINIGKRRLQFIRTPMVHWPDNMVVYVPEDKILFSNDAFGQHYSSSQRFDDECSLDIIIQEAKKYYANIVLPYSNQVQKVIDKLENIDISAIAPSHGVIWREHVTEIITSYKSWCSNNTSRKAVIVYDTMWKSTEKMAYAIKETFDESDYATVICNLQHVHMSDIMTELIESEYICVGTPTLNKTMMPSVAGFLTYLKGLAPKNRKTIAFGSYGWGGQGITDAAAYLKDTEVELVETYKQKYVPSREDLKAISDNLKTLISR